MWLPVSTPASPDRRSCRAGQRDEPPIAPRPHRNAGHGDAIGTRHRRRHRHHRGIENRHSRRRGPADRRDRGHRWPGHSPDSCLPHARCPRPPRSRPGAPPDPLVEAKTTRNKPSNPRTCVRKRDLLGCTATPAPQDLTTPPACRPADSHRSRRTGTVRARCPTGTAAFPPRTHRCPITPWGRPGTRCATGAFAWCGSPPAEHSPRCCATQQRATNCDETS